MSAKIASGRGKVAVGQLVAFELQLRHLKLPVLLHLRHLTLMVELHLLGIQIELLHGGLGVCLLHSGVGLLHREVGLMHRIRRRRR